MKTLNEVFEHEVKDLYSAESQLVKALPKMIKGAVSSDLREALSSHLEETHVHVQRLEQVAAACDFKVKGEKCKGMQGLIEEGGDLLGKEDDMIVRDLALIPAAQRVEHYEIAAYGSAVAFAKALGLGECESLLEQTLEEEKQADAKLTDISMALINSDTMLNNDMAPAGGRHVRSSRAAKASR
jgi:ferritin-like metal-binding protein YciE